MHWKRGRVGGEVKGRFVQGRSPSADRVSAWADHCCYCRSASFVSTAFFRSSPFQPRRRQPIRRRVAPFKTLAEATSSNSYPSCWLMPESPGTSLQVDCFPEANSTARHNLIRQTDLRKWVRGYVSSESSSHGSSAHSAEWFERGLRAATSLNVIVLQGDDPDFTGTVIRKAHEGDGW